MTWVCPARVWSWHSEPRFLPVYSPGQSFLRWASWTRARRAAALSCPWRASCRFLAAPTPPPGAPFLPGCTEPSVSLSKGQGIFLPNPPKTQPALEGFIIMQMSRIGSAPAEDSGVRQKDGLSLRLGHPWVGGGGRVGMETGLVPVICHPWGGCRQWGAGARCWSWGGGGGAGSGSLCGCGGRN